MKTLVTFNGKPFNANDFKTQVEAMAANLIQKNLMGMVELSLVNEKLPDNAEIFVDLNPHNLKEGATIRISNIDESEHDRIKGIIIKGLSK